jgi:transcriptional regulator with XRE-family HTH domain
MPTTPLRSAGAPAIALADRVRHARRLAKLSQATLAQRLGVVPSAVAQWEGRRGTSPTVANLARIAEVTGVAFEWLATGRGSSAMAVPDVPAVIPESIAQDMIEERLLLSFRKLAPRKREPFVRWLELLV